MKIVGYAHSDGYCLCTDCEDGTTIDVGDDSGFVYPIFDLSEWDFEPSCDVCGQALDVTFTDDFLLYSLAR